MNIKVQIKDTMTSAAIIACGTPKPGESLTFIAHSPQMKARVLEQFILFPDKVRFQATNERWDGERFEPTFS